MSLAERYLRSGKVRDLYRLGDGRLLLVASDRLSAFDVVLPTPIPDKGRVLTGISRFWFAELAGIVPNHLIGTDPALLPAGLQVSADELRGRMMLCREVEILPVEVIVRGYVAGSGWAAYRTSGEVCGLRLPSGLRESDRLAEPILTPSTKEEAGAHDQPIDFRAMVGLLGGDAAAAALAERVRDVAIALYRRATTVAERAGIIVADTKFEFGLDPASGDLVLADEVLTPDSSRFWDAATYRPGRAQESFDKQYVRDWLEGTGWDKRPPAPALPAEVVAGTCARYVAAFERLSGARFERYLEEDIVGR
ncbi:MAG: phosphoribosylaminoimidazolesuccinocarboxamide synthase [Candidatus Limnocylindrales bacterium]